MDELWQRYRTFWTPVLIGLGVFLIGVIAVHIMSDDPARSKARMVTAESALARMKRPSSSTTSVLKTRGEAFKLNVMGSGEPGSIGWAARLNQALTEVDDVVGYGAEQALRAAIVRGAGEDEARSARMLKARFDDDDVAADKAYKRFRRLVAQHRETLRSGDPNVAWSRLLSDVWGDLRVRANRADVEIGAVAGQLGFASISSVSRATLPSRVLNLALVARIVDIAIREGAESVDAILIPSNVDPGGVDDFLVLWPVELTLVAEMSTVKHVLDMLTNSANPVPLEYARLTQPKQGGTARRAGLVQFNVKASSSLIRADADLRLDAEEEK